MKEICAYLCLASALVVFSCGKADTPVTTDTESYELTAIPGSAFIRAQLIANGVVTESGFLLDNVRTGLWTSYHPDGRPSLMQHFINGKLNGPAVSMDTRGQITAQAYYTDGVYDGMMSTYRFGRVQEQIPYRMGQVHGVLKRFYPNGKLLEEAEYADNQQHGYYRRYDEDGVMNLEYVYEHGEIVTGGIVTE